VNALAPGCAVDGTSSPIRVVYLFGTAVIKGGGEVSLLELMSEIRHLGVDPIGVVDGPGEIQERLEAEGIRCIQQAVPPLRPWRILSCLRAYRALKQNLAELDATLLHANGARIMLYAGLAGRSLGIPCIWHVRVLDRDPFLDRVRGWLADRIIANAASTRQSLQALIRDSVRIVQIYNGIRLETCQGAPDHAMGRKPNTPPLILAVGRLSREKGYEDLLDACALLKQAGTAFNVRIIGNAPSADPAYADALRHRCDMLGLADHIAFAGWVQDVGTRMRQADVLVLPSRREAFGRVIVEAWAAGLPVIATRSGGPDELIQDGETGRLVPVKAPECLATAIQRLLADSAQQEKFRQAGYRKAGEFSLAEHARKVFSLYKVMLLEAARPPRLPAPDLPTASESALDDARSG